MWACHRRPLLCWGIFPPYLHHWEILSWINLNFVICFSLSIENTLLFLTFFFFNFIILYWFCHTLTWIHHGCTYVPHPEPPSHLLPHPIPLGHPSAPAPSTLYHALNLDWRFILHMIMYMFQCHSPISSCPLPLPQSPKNCSIYLCLFCVSHTGLSLPSF